MNTILTLRTHKGRKNAGTLSALLMALLVVGLMGSAQGRTGTMFEYQAGFPLVIGDHSDAFRYDGEEVRALRGSASIAVDALLDEGLVLAEVVTTEESGPIVISEQTSLEGEIRVVMERFLATESSVSGGVAAGLQVHGDTGIMTAVMPQMFGSLLGWGLLDIYVNGELLYEDVAGHFMVTERVRRSEEEGYEILRASDGAIYSPALEDKTGFEFGQDLELHLWAATTIGSIESGLEEEIFLHLNFLIEQIQEVALAEAIEPDEPEGEGPSDKEKGNNGLGNGVDPQPPGNPKPNDDEDSVANGKGKNK